MEKTQKVPPWSLWREHGPADALVLGLALRT